MMKQKSFTLIELLVVIVIIGILAGVIMISTSSSIDKANIAKLKVFEESVQNNLAANMVSAWDADHVTKTEAGNWTLNDKWGSNHGTFHNGTGAVCSSTSGSEACPQIVNDKQMGNVLSFDGVNDYISIPNIDIKNQLTVCGWFKINAGQYNTLIGNWQDSGTGDSWLMVTYPQKMSLFLRKSDNLSGNHIQEVNQPNYNQWYYYCGVFNNGYAAISRDGQLVSKTDYVGFSELYDNDLNLWIGKYATRYFNGLSNAIKIYNTTLSSSKIKQNYIAGLNSMLANENISKQEYDGRINALAYDN
jgi:prepilin-type N-terminal cleavage/methylation domain-containing protein